MHTYSTHAHVLFKRERITGHEKKEWYVSTIYEKFPHGAHVVSVMSCPQRWLEQSISLLESSAIEVMNGIKHVKGSIRYHWQPLDTFILCKEQMATAYGNIHCSVHYALTGYTD